MYRFYQPRANGALLACFGLYLVLLAFFFGCSSEPVGLKPPPENPIQLKVENNSADVIDVIQAKPCGSGDENYKTQIHGVKPQERITLQIYEECVDLVALDGFGNVMDSLVGLRLNSYITWKIH